VAWSKTTNSNWERIEGFMSAKSMPPVKSELLEWMLPGCVKRLQ